MNTKEMIDVMQAYLNGKEIEYCNRLWDTSDDDLWTETDSPSWNWSAYEFRVKPDSVN